MSELVRIEIDDRDIATITLARPGRLNAINMEMRDQLYTYFEALREMPDTAAVVFRGEGRAFSAGADITEFGTAPSLYQSRLARHERDLWALLLSLEMPLVTRLHGFALGGGLELALCCDLRIAAEGTRFGLPEVTLGYIPSAGATQTLPRTIPPGIAASLIVTGEPIGHEDALRWGLIHQAVPEPELDAAVERAIQSVLDGSAEVTAHRRSIGSDTIPYV